ncbi:MAG TPA: hypothetical protein VF791_05105 [Pyrinomonadaceae bacterium]
MRKLALLIPFIFLSVNAQAIPLKVVNVSAPPINCVFDASCTVVVEDTTAPIILAGARSSGFLQSRTFRGLPGSPAAGLYAYLYRVDMRNAFGTVDIGCVNSVTLNFGPVVSTLDFNGDGSRDDQVFVVTSGGIGSIGIASAEKDGNNITFTFSSPVCAGATSGAGQSSFFWGLVSVLQPRFVSASVTQSSGPLLRVFARAPRALGSGGITGRRRRGGSPMF